MITWYCHSDTENWELLHIFWWECKLVKPLWKSGWQFLKKAKNCPYNPAVPLLGICPQETKSLHKKDSCTPMLIAALFTIHKIWKQPHGLQWMNEERKCGIFA
jgi:hypothetical protein